MTIETTILDFQISNTYVGVLITYKCKRTADDV